MDRLNQTLYTLTPLDGASHAVSEPVAIAKTLEKQWTWRFAKRPLDGVNCNSADRL